MYLLFLLSFRYLKYIFVKCETLTGLIFVGKCEKRGMEM